MSRLTATTSAPNTMPARMLASQRDRTSASQRWRITAAIISSTEASNMPTYAAVRASIVSP